MRDFKSRVIGGLKWSFLSQFGGQVITIIISIVMARLIAPEYFGRVAMVNVIIGFSSIFLDLGFGAALIQKKEIDNSYYSTVFFLNLILGAVLSVMLFVTSEWIEKFYGHSGLSDIAKVLSPVFFINAMGNVPRTYLTKAMEFKKLSIINVLSLAIGGAIGISLAYKGNQQEAILAQVLIQPSIASLLLLFISGWRPSLILSKKVLVNIGGFSAYLMGNNIFNYWVRNIDNLLIGKYLGSQSLGIYSKSYSFLIVPLNNTSRAISKVLFPSLSEIQSDKRRVKKIYLNTLETIALIIYPIMIGVYVTANKLIYFVLGENWMQSVSLIKVFCLLAMIQSISSMVSNLYLSQGKANLMFKVGTILRVMLIASLIIGLNWGIMGVAVSYFIAGCISAPINSFFAGRLVGIKLFEIGKSIALPFILSVVMGLLISSIDLLIPNLTLSVQFLIQITVGFGAYLALNELLKIRSYFTLKALILGKVVR